jgi:hypothetical protein
MPRDRAGCQILHREAILYRDSMTIRTTLAAAAVLATMLMPVEAHRRAAKWTTVTPLSSVAGVGAGEPGLVSDGRGRVWLSWLEPAMDGGTKFRVQRFGGATTGADATIADGKNFFVNWADVPAVFRATDGTLVAHWLQRNGASKEAYDIKLATSADQGATWTPAGTPHRDGAEAEHGFVSFFDHPRGGVGLIWLDGRQMAGGHQMAGMAGMGGASTMLRTTQLTLANGARAFGEDGLVDPRVCDCCSTSAATTSDGVIVAYRDRGTPARPNDEVRDIAVSRFDGKTWSAPATVHADNWEINACPVNGPVVVARGKTVAVSWFTQAGGTAHSYLAFSKDAGRTFGAPVLLDSGKALGRLAMVMPDASSVLAGYIERVDDETALYVRQVRVDGRLQPPVKIAPVGSERASGFPRMAVDGERVVIAWTDVKSGRAAGVKVASLR